MKNYRGVALAAALCAVHGIAVIIADIGRRM